MIEFKSTVEMSVYHGRATLYIFNKELSKQRGGRVGCNPLDLLENEDAD